jgi:uncharacterized membrane protein YeaQ/YmgE (transglycosylase-associated protein family)
MGLVDLLIFLAIGLAAGWLAGMIMKKKSFGLVGNLIIGVIGAIIGGWLAQFVNLPLPFPIGAILWATIGAILLLFLLGFLKSKGVF